MQNQLKTTIHSLNKDYFEMFARNMPGESRVKYFDNEEGAAFIEFQKQYCPHLTQFTAYINAYERINVLSQLSKMDMKKSVATEKDGVVAPRQSCRAGSPRRNLG